jgi:lipopolysaccharide transport system ATP-binding protein
MNNISLKIENLSKQYRLGNIGTGTITDDFKRYIARLRGKEDPTLEIGKENKLSEKGGNLIYALKDINLEINKGDVVGFIGKNGAGKSTLLKILSRVTTPTYGTVDIYGRVASLLEVGTGFHPDLTGRENIFLNGAIMGMSKLEIRSKFEEIVEFSGVGKYIDTPVKRYSSGMYVRLAFAVAAHLEPEILIVDEVLAVGDAEFQKKAIGKMQDVSKNDGRTVLFVSHNMGAVKNLCNKGVLLENGMVKNVGNIDTVIESYFNQKSKGANVYFPENNVVKSVMIFQQQDKIILNLKYESDFLIKQPNFGFVIYDNYENPIFGTNPLQNGILDFGLPKKSGEIEVVISSPYLADGIYPVSIWFHDGNAFGNHLFKKDKCVNLEIEAMNNSYIEKNPNVVGFVVPICKWTFN